MYIIIDKLFIDTGWIENLDQKLQESGFNVFVSNYIKDLNDDLSLPKDFKNTENHVFIYGSIQFTKAFLSKYDHIVGFFDSNKLLAQKYLSNTPNHLFLNGKSIFITFGQLKQNKDWYYKLFNTNELFIRPDSSEKIFTGFLLHFESFDYEVNSLEQLTSVTNETLILLSKPQNILSEYRFFICNNEVLDGCQYIKNNEIETSKNVPEEALEVAQKFANIDPYQRPDQYLVCDVCKKENGDFKIVELNAMSTSDLYVCNPSVLYQSFKSYLEEYYDL